VLSFYIAFCKGKFALRKLEFANTTMPGIWQAVLAA